jgi:D-psicose/D-tagatose/L-ribulose 3-epimerase
MSGVLKSPLSIHSYVYMAEWSQARAPSAIASAASSGYSRMVVPLRKFESIDSPAIARLFNAASMHPVNSINLLPDADLSSLDADIRHRGINRVRQGLRLARDMGSHHVGGVLYGVLKKHEKAFDPEQWKHAAESLAQLAGEAKVMGIRLALEIVNRYESNLINTVEQAISFLKYMNSDNIFLHLDTFHMNIEEENMLTALEYALPYLVYLELDQNHRGRPDRGAIDFLPLLHKVFSVGYQDLIGIEAFSNKVISTEIGAAIGIWRNLFENGEVIGNAGMDVIRRARDSYELQLSSH